MPVFPRNAGATERFQWPLPGQRLGGLNRRDDPVRVPWHQFTQIKNILTREGAPVRRLGYGSHLASPLGAPATSFAWFQKADDTTRWLAFDGTTAHSLDGDPGAGVATDTTGGFANASRKRARQYADALYVVQGTSAVRKYDATSWTSVTPNAGADNAMGKAHFAPKYLAVGFERLWFAGSSQYPSYVWPSELADPTYCKETMAVRIDVPDGQDITGLLEWGRYILVPLERSLWAIPNKNPADSTYTQFRITADVGVPSGETLVGYNKNAFFLGSDRRVHLVFLGNIQDDLRTRPISALIQAELDGLTRDQLYSAEAVIWNDYYILAAGGKWYVLDLQTSTFGDKEEGSGAVWTIFEHAVAQTALWVHPTKQELYSADAAGQIRMHWRSSSVTGLRSTYQDDAGVPIDWKWETGWFHSGAEERQNLFTQFVAQVKATPDSQKVYLEMDTDAEMGLKTYNVECKGGGFVLGASVLGQTKLGVKNFAVPINQTPPSIGRRWRLRAYRGTDTKETKVYSVTLQFRRLTAF